MATVSPVGQAVNRRCASDVSNARRRAPGAAAGAEADKKVSRRFGSINLVKPMETVVQFPFVFCAWPSFADQPYITNYRIYDDRVGETTRFSYRVGHE